jgi:hypothetical protein
MVDFMPLAVRTTLARVLPRRAALFLVVLTLLGAGMPIASPAAEVPTKADTQGDVKLLPTIVAAETVASGNTTAVVALLTAGQSFALWGDWPDRTSEISPKQEKAEAIDRDLLAAVKDLTGRPDPKKTPLEFRAWNETIFIAAQTRPEAFAKSAQDNQELTWATILRAAPRYRGKVIRVAGRLIRLRRQSPPEWVRSQGVKSLYEGQVLVDGFGQSPVLVLCTELGTDLREGGKLFELVALDGYFLKKLLEKSDRNIRVMPLVVGRVLRRDKATAAVSAERAPAIEPLLAGVKDQTRPPDPERNIEEFWGYCETICTAAQTPERAFAASARATSAVTFAHLHLDPARYRGKVIPITGRLERLFEAEIPDSLKQRGIRRLYEGWVFGPTRGTNPFCVLFTDLPKGFRTGGNVDYAIDFEGYFFKKIRYSAEKDDRYTSMLIGRTIRLNESGPARARPADHPPKEKDDGGAQAPAVAHFLKDVEDEKRTATPRTNAAEFWGYCETILVAAKTSAQAFAHSAKDTGAVKYTDLLVHPTHYRGKVVHVDGILERLRRFEAPEYLQVRGIDHLYEGWVVNKSTGRRPWCLIFTELPSGIEVGESISYSVTFDGYFFKKYKFRAGERDLYAPQVLGRTVRLRASAAGTFSNVFVVTLTSLVAGMIFLVVALSWWFRRGDRRLRSRLAGALNSAGFDPQHVHVPAADSELPGDGAGPAETDGFLQNGR